MSKQTILSPGLLWTTIGSFALIFLGAFEALAVTTIMPTIALDLDGESLYSLAFSSTFAASVIGMVVAGRMSDDSGPGKPLLFSLGAFLAGLLVSGLAVSMEVFVVGRVLQGLGAGGITVALYVVVGRLYPPVLHPKIFGAFAAAWVLPSLIGPPLAGVVAEVFSWHWVFLGVGGLVVIAGGAVVPALVRLRSLPASAEPPETKSWWSVVWAVVLASGILSISFGGELHLWWLVILASAVVVIALRPLVPSGTVRALRGLPATVLLRGLIAGSFYAAEIYLPYMLTAQFGLPIWAAGLILTVGALSWTAGSQFQASFGDRIAHSTLTTVGSVLLLVGTAIECFTALFGLGPVVAAVGWLIAGGGMGIQFPRINTLVLGFSTERNQGFNTAAMSIADATGGATTIAFAGLIFLAFGGPTSGGFAVALGLTAALAIVAIPVATRVRARLP